MTCEDRAAGLLPFYATGSLDERERRAVEAHLVGCAACRTDLALWTSVNHSVRGDAPTVAPPACERALAKTSVGRGFSPGGGGFSPGAIAARSATADRAPLHVRAWALLVAQVPLVGSDIWISSAVVMAIGYALAVVVRQPSVFDGVAPLAAAGTIAAVYRPTRDPAFEMTLATPTSPRQILLARLVLVFGYNLTLGLVASLGLAAVLPSGLMGAMIAGWLAPMTFLSALALVLSLVIGAPNAMAVSFGMWVLRGMSAGHVQFQGGEFLRSAAALYQQAWHQSAWLVPASAGLVAIAVWLAGRPERSLNAAA